MATVQQSRQPSSLAARRDARPLPFLKTSFDDTLLQVNSPRFPAASKSVPNLRPGSRRRSPQRTNSGQSSRAPSIKKAHPKSSLLNLFSKPKVEYARGYNESGLPSTPQSTATAPNFSRPSTCASRSTYSRPALSRQQSSELSMLSKVQTRESDQEATPRAPAHGRDMGFADALKDLEPPSKASVPSSPVPSSWAPPPLFQAYPQAALHAELEDPDHHTLRLSRPKRRGHNLSGSGEGKLKPAKGGLRRPSVQRSISSTTGEATDETEPTPARKVYMLVTTGHVLQYSGDGPSDRYPEKVLKLGPSSKAFASDAIPGKHWVLQVLQAASDDELNPFANEKSILSRLLPTSKAKKKATRNMLLVLDSPADMNKWLVSIRNEVQKFSNRPSRPQTPSRRMPVEQESQRQPPVPYRILTMARPATPSNLSKPSSPLKPPSSGPSGPASPTFLDSGYISSGTTLAGDMSSTRSSQAPAHGKTISDLQKILYAPASHSDDVQPLSPTSMYSEEAANNVFVPQQPPNTAIPPLTPMTPNVNIQLADSPDQTHPSPERRRGSLHSRKDSPDQPFCTPASTPMYASFPQSESATTATDGPSSFTPHQRASLAPSDARNPAIVPPLPPHPPFNPTPSLRPSKSAPGLYTFNEVDEEEAQQPEHFSGPMLEQQNEVTKSGSSGNAFAQQAARGHPKSQTASPNLSLPARKSSLQPLGMHSVPENSVPEKPNKRTSFRSNSPLPLQTASSASTANSSARTSLRLRDSLFADLGLGIHSIPGAFPSSDRNSALLQLTGQPTESSTSSSPPSSSALQTPTSNYSTHSPTIPNFSDRTLKRPPTIQINTNVPAFLSAPRHSSGQTGMSSSAPASAVAGKTPTPTSSVRAKSARNSVLVPVVRPPIRGGQRMSRQARLGGPPTSTPPSAPLPPTPPQQPAAATAAPIASH